MSNLIHYILETGVCMAIFYAGYWIFLRNETYFNLNRIYLVFSVVFSFVIPGLNLSSPFIKSQVIETTYSMARTTALPARSWGLAEILLLIYVAGVGLFLLRFVFHLAKLFVVVKKYGIKNYEGTHIVSVDKEFSPFSFFNIIFINDNKITENDLRRIIAHEKIHIKQYHSFDIMLMEMVTIFQWFNPFVWPYKKSLQETHEYLADYGVIAQGFSVAKYKLLMFEQHVGVKLLEFASNFKQSQIKRRITMMTKNKSRSVARLKFLLVLPLASLLVLAFADPRAAESPQPQVDEAMEAEMLNRDGTPEQTQNSDKKKEEELKKKMMQLKLAQMKDDYKKLTAKEKDIRMKLEAAESPEERKELKAYLSKVLEKKAQLKAVLEGKSSFEKTDESSLKKELMMLMEKEQEIRKKMEKVEDPEKKAELKKLLSDVLKREKLVKMKLESSEKSDKFTADELLYEFKVLKEKEMKVRAKLKEVENPEKKEQLKQLLEEILIKQQAIKKKLEAMKTT
ncbi:MAG: M56 family metallopeptidase [Candidatus Aminicenantaceae bacterium]